jgi:hypothetical protein
MTIEELTFEDYAKSITDVSSILPDDAIAGYLAQDKMQPIMLYAYRIAAYVAQELRTSGKMPSNIDDTDYIDAVQECIPHVPQLVRSWSKNPSHKFSTYVNRAFSNIISHYLWTLSKGGLGDWHSDAPQIEQLPEPEADDEGNFEADAAEFAYPEPPQGFRDPMEELIAAQEEDRALRALLRPAATAEETHKRNIRARKLLGLKGAKHDA